MARLDGAWKLIARALVLKERQLDKKWTLFTLHFMRMTVHRRVAKVQALWRDYKARQRQKEQEEQKRQRYQHLCQAANQLHKAMLGLNNLKQYKLQNNQKLQAII